MRFIIPVESILQNKGGVILYDVEENKILKQYVHDKKWKRTGWRGGKIHGEYLISTDWNDLHYFNVKEWKYEKTFQKSTFNDLHYVEIFKNKLYVVNTGLDAVEIFDDPMDPKFLDIIFLFKKNKNIFGKRDIDLEKKYNKLMKLKPHMAHPNCISVSKKGIFVTCFGKNQKINSGEIIDLNTGARMTKRRYDCHDGLFYKNKFYTTWTRHSQVLEFDNLFDKEPPNKISIGPRGWWRGMLIKDDFIYVFASDGYRGTKTTTRLAIINLKTKNRKIQKLPVVDGIYWDTIYQPNIYEV